MTATNTKKHTSGKVEGRRIMRRKKQTLVQLLTERNGMETAWTYQEKGQENLEVFPVQLEQDDYDDDVIKG